MPSFAELRDKAVKAKDAGISKIQDTRDRHTSVPLAKTNWDPYSKKPPPPPPPTKSAASSARSDFPPPPKLVRSTRPAVSASNDSREPSNEADPSLSLRDVPTRPPALPKPHISRVGQVPSPATKIDWSNISPEDKEVLFSWLDEFFSRLLNISIPPRHSALAVSQAAPKSSYVPPPQTPSGRLEVGPPPKVATWSRPKSSSPGPSGTTNNFNLSHPPQTTYGSAGLDLAYYFQPTTHWSEPWYASDDLLPPPVRGSKEHAFSCAWQSRNSDKHIFCGVIFSDLSFCWGNVQFSMAINADPNDASLVKRSARYLPPPRPLRREELVEAHETYGETIAAFAESYLGTGQYCGRGECWDLANEALKYFSEFDYVSKPVPSLSRTHGHLIFEGKAIGRGNTIGRWRGGDDRVRRGDIVEWRKVKITIVNAPPNSWAILGDPDHTAIITRDAPIVGGRRVQDGDTVKPEELGSLEVVEQSLGSPPDKKEYDLSGFEQGEMWIYRPIGMKTYLGCMLTAKYPEDIPTMSI